MALTVFFKDTPDVSWLDTTDVLWPDTVPKLEAAVTYESLREQLSREPVSLVVLTVDRCALTYGVSPCTASKAAGEECYNTWRTCQDLVNYDRETIDLKFSSADARPIFDARPYVKSAAVLPTRLSEKLTSKARVKISMLDELSDDIGVDPYVATRPSIQGEYWKKFIARNPNYEGWIVKVYQGFVGLDESDFVQRWEGTLENITNRSGVVTLDTIDMLATIDKFDVPEKIESELLNNITDSQTTIVLTSLLKADEGQIDPAGYIQIEGEIIEYTSLDVPANQLLGCTRGSFSTIAAAHDAEERITLVKYYAPDNPFDMLHTIWDEAGGDSATEFNTDVWAYWRDWPKTDIDFSAIIVEDEGVDASTLFWEVARLLDAQIWQAENQKISIRRNLSNDPGREFTVISDDANIINRSTGTDYNSKSRKSRIVMYWGKSTLGELDNPASYNQLSVVLDEAAESADGYNDVQQELINNRWLSKRFLQEETVDRYTSALIRRRLFSRRDAQPITTLEVDLKDEGLLTGDNAILQSDELLNPDGTPISKNNYIISRRKRGGKLQLELRELPRRRICFIAPSGHPDYEDSLVLEQEYGYICNNNGDMPNGDPGYYIY